MNAKDLVKSTIIFAAVTALLGCATQKPPLLLSGTDSGAGAFVCLEDKAKIPAFFTRFFKGRDRTSEEEKIEYLLERVRTSPLSFYRNREKFNGQDASEFLRWKLGRMPTRYHVVIKTADEFIEKVASYSRASGNPYVVEIPNVGTYPLHQVLRNELDVLNTCLNESSEKASTA